MAPAADAIARSARHGRPPRSGRARHRQRQGRPVTSADEIVTLLVEQVTGQVRWRETVEWFAANGVHDAL